MTGQKEDDGALTIGELSRRTGIPVKTLRFYSDEGLLPPARRSRANYRLYDEEQVVRLDLVRTLREAGLDLGTIRGVLARAITLEDALRLRLAAVDAHVASLTRVGAAIRAALRAEPTQADLRRLTAVTRLSSQERKAVITRFYDQVADGVAIDRDWVRSMVDASSPELPPDATPAQLDAWIELAELLADPTFVASMRAVAADAWNDRVDRAALMRATGETMKSVREARERGVDPASPEALAVAQRFVEASAAANGVAPDEAFRDRFRKTHDPRALRYWELVGAMKGEATSPELEDGRWLGKAIMTYVA